MVATLRAELDRFIRERRNTRLAGMPRTQVEIAMPPYRLEAGQSNPISFQSRNVMGPEGDDISRFAGNWRLYIMGWIEYTDDLDNHRRTAFCREYRQISGGSGGRFFPVDDPDYEHEE
jgi:hypothetical protein